MPIDYLKPNTLHYDPKDAVYWSSTKKGEQGTGSLYQQIQCPTDLPDSCEKAPCGNFKGLKYTLGQAVPESIGYIIGNNFTGWGKNEDSFFGKLGLDFKNGIRGSKRITGHNYYIPFVNKTCDKTSSHGCGGQPAHLYIRGYPTWRGGNLSFGLLEDVLDVNPFTVLASMYQGLAPVKCERHVLPVGSNFDLNKSTLLQQKGSTFMDVRDILRKDISDKDKEAEIGKRLDALLEQCRQKCVQDHKINLAVDGSEVPSGLNNCIKDCRRVWWEQDKCMVNQKGVFHNRVNYPAAVQTTVIITSDNKNIVFELETGVHVTAIFDRQIKLLNKGTTHFLKLQGLVNVPSGQQATSAKKSLQVATTTADDRYQYTAVGKPANSSYVLTIREWNDGKAGNTVAIYNVNVKTGDVEVERSTTKSNALNSTTFKGTKQQDGSFITKILNNEKVTYRIPSVLITGFQQQENKPDVHNLQSGQANARSPDDIQWMQETFANDHTLDNDPRPPMSWKVWLAALVGLALIVTLVLYKH